MGPPPSDTATGWGNHRHPGDTAGVPQGAGRLSSPRRMARTATLRNVELVSVGTWAASTGVTKVTRADLEACLAAHADGLVDHAPIKLGHVSPLNDELGDGAPAYGWVVPTRIDVNASGLETLYGDLVGMPAALAEVAPTAYRRRSVEIAWNVKTPGGKTYAAALIGIALLGASAPAVKGLADLVALYAGGEPEVERVDTLELVTGLEDNAPAVAMLAAARKAGATVEQVDAMAAAAGARDTADVPPPVEDADNDEQQTAPPTTAPAPPNGRTTMTDEELRAALNLEADADVNTALNNLLAERASDPATASTDPQAQPDPEQGGDQGGEQQPEQGSEQQGEEAGAASPAPELVTLSAATYSELTAAAETIRRDRLARTLDDAVRSGRIAPAERGKLTHELAAGETVSGFAASLEANEAATVTLLSGLAPRFAVTEFGADHAPNAEAAEQAYDEFERQTFGVER